MICVRPPWPRSQEWPYGLGDTHPTLPHMRLESVDWDASVTGVAEATLVYRGGLSDGQAGNAACKIRPLELATAIDQHTYLRSLDDVGLQVDGDTSLVWSDTGYEYRNVPVAKAGTERIAWLPRHAWKLLLATATVWVAAMMVM